MRSREHQLNGRRTSPSRCGFRQFVLLCILPVAIASCGQKPGRGGKANTRSSDREMTPKIKADAVSTPPRRIRKTRRRASRPTYVAGPVVVRQILVDPGAQLVLTEEADTALCADQRLRWNSWMKCVDSRLARDPDGSWMKKMTFHLRWRTVKQLKLSGELTRQGKPFRRLLDFAQGRALEAGDAKSALVVHDLQRRKHRRVPRMGLAAGEHVRSAAILPGGKVLAVTVSGRKTPTARLRLWSAGDQHLRKPSLTFRYISKRFLGPNLRKAGMAVRYLYLYCGARDKVACDNLKQVGGTPYEQRVERDRAVALAVSRTGDKIVLYAFGTLYLYHLHGTELSLKRRWVDIFYSGKDSYLRRPGLRWDPTGRWLAMTSTIRHNLVVDMQSGRVKQVRDYALPHATENVVYGVGYRGAAFVEGPGPSLMIGDLRGDLLRINLQTRSRKQFKLPEAKGYDHDSEPGMIAYLQRSGDNLVAWRDGAVYVLDVHNLQLRARMGTYAALGWSRLLSDLKIP